ncbi:class I SAM-dependent methyltransferase [Pseudoalteromonas sp. SSDWG2]|uniref:class I SAM-dependent methyltransferase n=1 Tax=Pseudoalteromonas sp. SSDWG2 TaxID=3139391 RepID=UPI003BACA581
MKHWQSFWQQTSMVSSFGREGQRYGYPETIERFWRRVAVNFNNEDSVLDIACGKGALALLIANECAQTPRALDIHATDIVEIDLSDVGNAFEEFESITWTLGYSLDALPYEKMAFNHLVSQFGVEYAGFDESLVGKLLELVKPNGTINFLVHSKDSAISVDSASGIRAIEAVFNSGLFLWLYQRFCENAASQQIYDYLDATFNSISSELAGNSWLEDIKKSFMNLVDAQKQNQVLLLDKLASNLEQTVSRLHQQIKVALNTEELKVLLGNFINTHFEVTPVEVDGARFGIHIYIKKL